MRRPWLYNGRAHGGLITIDDPAHIAKLANRPGPLGPDEIGAVAGMLAKAFPSTS
jgi:hypothetical protein